MKIHLLLATLLVIGFSLPSFAATSGYTDGCIIRGNQKICPLK
jgi:hypothetical protein